MHNKIVSVFIRYNAQHFKKVCKKHMPIHIRCYKINNILFAFLKLLFTPSLETLFTDYLQQKFIIID